MCSMRVSRISIQSQTKTVAAYIFKIVALAVVYHMAARLGLKMAYVQANSSQVWLPTGIGIAALPILGTRFWPGISLGVLLGSLLTGVPLNLAAQQFAPQYWISGTGFT